jgi:mRNA interferase RelE/StbE
VTNTPYHVKIAPAAQRQILALQAKSQKMMIKFIEALAINPRPPGVIKIEGLTGLYCEHVNHHRLIYKVEEQEVLLLLLK